MPQEATDALEKYVKRRPVDPEGLYYLGTVLQSSGNNSRAREMFEQAIESVAIAPSYRRREIGKWGALALRALKKSSL
jgi:Flp pilus assembly protein TadD